MEALFDQLADTLAEITQRQKALAPFRQQDYGYILQAAQVDEAADAARKIVETMIQEARDARE